MPKVFYTETDIEDMVKRGTMSLEINDNVVLTDLAYEKAQRLGLKLVQDKPENPPAAPVRPYVANSLQPPKPAESYSRLEAPPRVEAPRPVVVPAATATPDLAQRIRSAVLARLGSQVDGALLDVIIQRVLASTGGK